MNNARDRSNALDMIALRMISEVSEATVRGTAMHVNRRRRAKAAHRGCECAPVALYYGCRYRVVGLACSVGGNEDGNRGT